MKNKLTHNLGLKIVAVVAAILLWLINVNLNNPLSNQQISNLSVQMINTGYITSQGKTFKVMENTDTVRLTVRAPKNVLSEISRESFSLRADFSKITEENTVPIEWVLNDRTLEGELESVHLDKEYVKLQVENHRSRQLAITVVKTGSLPAGYVTGRTDTETNMMSISGPESVLSTVAKAAVEVSLDSVTSDVEIVAKIRLLDADGNEVTSSDIQKSIQDVKVTIPVYPTKEVPIRYGSSGSVEDGYVLTGLAAASPATVLIAGKENAINNVEEIVIPETELDVTAARENVTVTVDIRPYLPADVSLADTGFDGRVTLTALVEPILHRTFEFDTDAVQILNIPENWLAELVAGQKISVTVYGLQADLNAIDANSLTPHTDVDTLKDDDGGITPGEQDIEIRFLMPDNVRQETAVTARIRLVELTPEE